MRRRWVDLGIMTAIGAAALIAACGGDDAGKLAITSVEPASLPYASGGELVVRGGGFGDGVSLLVDGVPVTISSRKNSAITATLPARERGGAVTLTVERDGSKVSWEGFRFGGIAANALSFVRRDTLALAPKRLIPASAAQPGRFYGVGDEGIWTIGLKDDALSELAFTPVSPNPTEALATCAHDLNGDGVQDLLLVRADGTGERWLGLEDGKLTPPGTQPPPPEQDMGGMGDMGDAADMGMGEPADMGAGEPADMGTTQQDMPEPVGPEVTVHSARCDVYDGQLTLYLVARVGEREVIARVAPADLSSAGIANNVVAQVSDDVRDITVGRLDGDTYADIVVRRDGAPPSIWFGSEAGLARAAIGTTPQTGDDARAVVLVDVDEDGDLDVVMATPRGVDIWRWDDGVLHDISREVAGAAIGSVRAITPADVNRDGRVDLIVVGDNNAARLLLGGESLRFYEASNLLRPAGVERGVRGVVVADLDGDKDDDLVLYNGATLQRLVNWAPASITDTDGDGLPDDADLCPTVYDPEQKNRDAHPFLCESPEACAQETGCTLLPGAHGSLYLYCSTMSTRDGARDFCRSRNARLPHIESAEEQAWINANIKGRYWIAANDRATEGTFVHDDGSAAEFLGWLENQPDNAGAGEHCVELISEDGRIGWNDLPCDADRAVLCEATPRTGKPDPGDACDVCPNVHDPQQADRDGDGFGDACDVCPTTYDAEQKDSDGNGVGDACQAPEGGQ